MTDPKRSDDDAAPSASEAEPDQESPEEPAARGADPRPGHVQFAAGVAVAADPEPTPVTIERAPSDPLYAVPVDPWAGHPEIPPTPVHGLPSYPRISQAAAPRRRTWLVALVAAVLTGVLAVATAAVVYFWPRYPALDFQRLGTATRFAPIVAVSSSFSDATVVGDRFYFASSDALGALGVTAVDGASAQATWSSTAAGTAKRWENMMGVPYGLAITGVTDSATHPNRIAVLGADRGELLWDLKLGPRDRSIFGKSVVVHIDQGNHQLIGYDGATGNERWRLPDLSETGTQTLAVSTPEDLTGPASGRGRPFTPAYTDNRLVQINADHSVRVMDMASGTVGKSWQTGAATDDEVFAHNGRLIIRESGNVQRIVAYELDSGSPVLLYTAEQNVRLTDLTPCGDDHVCFVKTRTGETGQTVIRLSTNGGDTWESSPVSEVVRLVPVGNAVVVQSETNTTLIDAKGTTAWTHPGTVARLDSGNMLRFGHVFTNAPIDESLSGQHLGDDPVELGAMYDVRTETCAWTTTMVGCVTENDYMMQRFAG